MNTRQKHVSLPAATAAGSFLSIVILAASTSPINKISYAIVFFALTGVFLVSVGHLVTYFRHGSIRLKSRYRIFITSFLILVALMLLSSQSLNPVDALVLLLIGAGLWFYSGRRSF